MLDKIGKWSVKRKILIFCALPLVTWLVIGIVVFLLGVPFSAVDYYTAIVLSFPGVLGIVVIIFPDAFAEIFLRERVPVRKYVDKKLSGTMDDEVELSLFSWDSGIHGLRRAIRLYFRIGGMAAVVVSSWMVWDILSHV